MHQLKVGIDNSILAATRVQPRIKHRKSAVLRSGIWNICSRIERGRQLSLSLREMDQSFSVIFKLPGFAISAGGAQADNLPALRHGRETGYFKDGDTL